MLLAKLNTLSCIVAVNILQQISDSLPYSDKLEGIWHAIKFLEVDTISSAYRIGIIEHIRDTPLFGYTPQAIKKLADNQFSHASSSFQGTAIKLVEGCGNRLGSHSHRDSSIDFVLMVRVLGLLSLARSCTNGLEWTRRGHSTYSPSCYASYHIHKPIGRYLKIASGLMVISDDVLTGNKKGALAHILLIENARKCAPIML